MTSFPPRSPPAPVSKVANAQFGYISVSSSSLVVLSPFLLPEARSQHRTSWAPAPAALLLPPPQYRASPSSTHSGVSPEGGSQFLGNYVDFRVTWESCLPEGVSLPAPRLQGSQQKMLLVPHSQWVALQHTPKASMPWEGPTPKGIRDVEEVSILWTTKRRTGRMGQLAGARMC